MQHVGARSVQQDAFLISDTGQDAERGLLAVLADGMGGMQAGEQFSSLAVREMVGHFSQARPSADPCCDLLDAYQAAREKALHMSREEELDGGATVTAVLLRDDHCAILSVGDSRIYLFRGKGLVLLNREQTLGTLLDERVALGRISREEALRNLHRAALVNHLCEERELPTDRNLSPFRLLPGDKLALMSDGAFSALESSEIAAFMDMPGTTGADALIKNVLRRDLPRQDNLSVLMLAVLER